MFSFDVALEIFYLHNHDGSDNNNKGINISSINNDDKFNRNDGYMKHMVREID